MDLLGQELNNKKKMPTSKKIVLVSLIVCIVLLVLILVFMFLMSSNQTKPLTLVIDGQNIQISNNILISDDNQITYISLKQLSKLIGYEYLRGGYLEYIEDDTKCYLESTNQIIGFEANSNKIYKTSSNSKTDYQYYELKNNIIKNDEVLYISIEDLNVGCNVVFSFSKQENRITIDTIDNKSKYYETQLSEKSMAITSDSFNNGKALSYGMIVVSNNNGKLGVINFDYQTIIGNKYTTMEFDEFSKNFIVSDENRYGVISKEGRVLVELKYEDIEIINYSPLLYKVKQNNKYGMLGENGNVIINTEYDGLGSNNYRNNLDLIIQDIDNNKQDGIIVNKNGKYGIMNIKTGETILDCILDRIYYETSENNKITYYVQVQNSEMTLEEYMKYANTTVVNL